MLFYNRTSPKRSELGPLKLYEPAPMDELGP